MLYFIRMKSETNHSLLLLKIGLWWSWNLIYGDINNNLFARSTLYTWLSIEYYIVYETWKTRIIFYFVYRSHHILISDYVSWFMYFLCSTIIKTWNSCINAQMYKRKQKLQYTLYAFKIIAYRLSYKYMY